MYQLGLSPRKVLVRPQVSLYEICGGHSSTWQALVPVLLFSLSISFHQGAILIFI